jgi:chromosome partitioning protein
MIGLLAMTTVIAFTSQKGGSGKTTLCINMAVAAERAGDGPVHLIDTDPQGTLAAWRGHRKAESPQRLEGADVRTILSAVPNLSPPPQYVLIDTAPSEGKETIGICRLADLVIVPVRPSAADLWSVSKTIDELRKYKIPFLFAITQVRANSAVTAQVCAALSHFGPVAETFQVFRTAYATALTDGRVAAELHRTGPAADESAGLWKNIKATVDSIASKNSERGNQ